MSRNVTKTRRSQQAFTLIEVMIVLVILGILFNIAVPSLVRAREQARAKSCIQNLKRIDSAKQQWAITTRKTGSVTPLSAELYGAGLYIQSTPTCPAGYAYSINALDTEPTCGLGKTFPPYFHALP